MTPGGGGAGARGLYVGTETTPRHESGDMLTSRVPTAGKKTQEKQGFPSSHGSTTGSAGAAKAPEPEGRGAEAQICHLCARLTVSRRFDLIQSDTLREYFSSRHPKAIGIISAAYFNSQLIFDVLFV